MKAATIFFALWFASMITLALTGSVYAILWAFSLYGWIGLEVVSISLVGAWSFILWLLFEAAGK